MGVWLDASNFLVSSSLYRHAGLVPGIHVLLKGGDKDVDGRVKPGHDDHR
jgi:hypothetical protein